MSLAAANGVTDGRLRIQVTRGTPPEPAGADPGPGLRPTLLVTTEAFAGYPEEIYREGIACQTVAGSRGRYARVKSIGLLGAILARQEALAAGAREAILTTGHGRMLEGSVSNIFFQAGQVLFTAPDTARILSGVTRSKIIDIAAGQGLQVEFQTLKLTDLDPVLFSAYLTGSVLGICPVSRIDDLRLKRDETMFNELSTRLAELETESID